MDIGPTIAKVVPQAFSLHFRETVAARQSLADHQYHPDHQNFPTHKPPCRLRLLITPCRRSRHRFRQNPQGNWAKLAHLAHLEWVAVVDSRTVSIFHLTLNHPRVGHRVPTRPASVGLTPVPMVNRRQMCLRGNLSHPRRPLSHRGSQLNDL